MQTRWVMRSGGHLWRTKQRYTRQDVEGWQCAAPVRPIGRLEALWLWVRGR